jgi:hypothetical protein
MPLRAATGCEFDLVRKRPGLETGSNLDTDIAWSITYAMLNLPLDKNAHVSRIELTRGIGVWLWGF